MSRGCLNCYKLQKLGIKSPWFVLTCPNVQVLLEDVMNIYQGEILMSGGDT